MNLELGNHTYKELISEVNNKALLLTENLEWTVGTRGKFTDLRTALNEASRFTAFNSKTLTIRFLEDITLSSSIIISNKHFGFLILDFNNFKLTITNGGVVLSNTVINRIKNINIESDHNCVQAYVSTLVLEGRVNLKSKNDCLVSDNGSFIGALNNNMEFNLEPATARYGIYATRNSRIAIGDNARVTQNQGTIFNVNDASIINCEAVEIIGSATQSNQSFNVWTKSGFICK